MKNIHLLSTPKPSRLVKFFTNKFHLCKEILPIHDEEQYQNIYITNSEEIKEGDWFLNDMNILFKAGKNYIENPAKEVYIGHKKIILTTDQELIKDGVQAIPDEFLEWFVKNPSCEDIEVNKIYKDYGETDIFDLVCTPHSFKYKITIPKEEPKKETLEEVAEKYATNHGMMAYVFPEKKESFIEGAKWQKEQDKNKYSEEDMRKMYDFGSIGHFTENESLEQFKKK